MKPAPRKRKATTTETLHVVTNVFEHGNFSRQMLEKKDYVGVSKGVHKPLPVYFSMFESVCNLQEFYATFRK